jgi:NitT/TauT family transport system substrate-binding protein
MRKRLNRPAILTGLLTLSLLTAACGGGGGGDSTPEAEGENQPIVDKVEQVDLRLGYFPNVTHAAAVAGVERGIFAEALGDNVNLQPATFNAGPAAVEALFSGALDATYIGPNPAINAFAKSKGEAVRIIAGATSGGASLVVKPNINSVKDLKGKKVATPQLGNTQDVAARAHFAKEGLKTNPTGGGDVSITPQQNAQTLELFKSGQIAGAWVPEPWATRLVQEGGGKVLIDERDLWPGGEFVTTHLIVRTEFLEKHPDVVKDLLAGHLKATEFVNRNPAEAQTVVNAGIERITGKRLPDAVISSAWKSLKFTFDPVASSLYAGADAAKAVGLLDAATVLDGIYSVGVLNDLLAESGQAKVEVPAATKPAQEK